MTGFQPSLTTGRDGRSDASGPNSERGGNKPDRFSIEDAVRGLGVRDVHSVDPFDEEATRAALKKAKAGRGVNVVVCHSPCVVHDHRMSKGPRRACFAIDQQLCNACSLCVRLLGCPAILVADGEYTIDPELCDGCELCADVCQHDAIRTVAPEKGA